MKKIVILEGAGCYINMIHIVDKLIEYSRKPRTRGKKIRALVLDEMFFLLIVPWFLILPSRFAELHLFPSLSLADRPLAGGIIAAAGLFLSLTAVKSLWEKGRGTPSLKTPTEQLVTTGVYALCRNPLQLGALFYTAGLGTLLYSPITGGIAALIGLISALIYLPIIERKELTCRFGEEYLAYRKHTPFLIPTPHSIAAFFKGGKKTLETEGRVLNHAALIYDFVQPFVTFGQEKKLNHWLAGQLKLKGGEKVLDVGCGTGLLTAEIAARKECGSVMGIDASESMITVARKKRGKDNCAYRQALGENLPFEDGTFDIVTSALFFHHINSKLKMKSLREIMRTLKPGGTLFIADMDKPYTLMGKITSWLAWKMLRQPEIRENMNGMVRDLAAFTGFEHIKEIGRFSGYITVIRAVKE